MEGKRRAQNPIADYARCLSLGEGSSHALQRKTRASVEMHERSVRPDSVGSDQEALEDTVRVSLHQMTIRKEAGGSLFSVRHSSRTGVWLTNLYGPRPIGCFLKPSMPTCSTYFLGTIQAAPVASVP